MTIQFEDTVILKKSHIQEMDYELLDTKDGFLFNPNEYGFIPKKDSFISACMKGFLATYVFTDKEVILKDLYINADNPLILNGVSPVIRHSSSNINFETFESFMSSLFYLEYKDVNLKLSVPTTAVLIGKKIRKGESIDYKPYYDIEGYDIEGYDIEGYDIEGYDIEGYDIEELKKAYHEITEVIIKDGIICEYKEI